MLNLEYYGSHVGFCKILFTAKVRYKDASKGYFTRKYCIMQAWDSFKLDVCSDDFEPCHEVDIKDVTLRFTKKEYEVLKKSDCSLTMKFIEFIEQSDYLIEKR